MFVSPLIFVSSSDTALGAFFRLDSSLSGIEHLFLFHLDDDAEPDDL
jgi:hypothetical protein